jgi:hypothetical protein
VVHTKTAFFNKSYTENNSCYHENYLQNIFNLEYYNQDVSKDIQLHFHGRGCWDGIYTYEHLKRTGSRS